MMSLASTPRRIGFVLAAAVLLLGLGAGAGHAKKTTTYYFLLHHVSLAKDIPEQVGQQVRAQVVKAITAHERLIAELPADAPNPDENPKGFVRYLRKHRITPFRFSVDVTEYSHEVEALPAPRKGQRLNVGVALHAFGETMPKRVMAFSGDGSATIKMDIGKRLRKRDSTVANRDAINLAVTDALAACLEKLDSKKRKKRSRRNKRKK
jgi:hypothetical protein